MHLRSETRIEEELCDVTLSKRGGRSQSPHSFLGLGGGGVRGGEGGRGKGREI